MFVFRSGLRFSFRALEVPEPSEEKVDKAPRLSISIVILILSSDTVIRQLNQFNTNSEAAMLSTQILICVCLGDH